MTLALAHPGLFWTGLALVSVPILIHLFFRRRHRVVRWAAMDFLLAALRKQKRRIEVENLILLLLRCTAILLLGIAVARPAVQAAGLNPFGAGARAVVLVLDTSTSMGALYTARTALERAKERAGKLLADLSNESKVTLVVTRDDTNGGGPRALLENASPAEVRTRLPGVRLSYGPNRLGEVFRRVGDHLGDLSGRRLVVFVTDLQRRDYWDDRNSLRQDVLGALKDLDREEGAEPTPVAVLDVGGPEAGNLVVTRFTVDEGRTAFAGNLLGIEAEVVNHGPESVRGVLSMFLARPDGEWEKAGDPLEIEIKGGDTVKNELLHRLPTGSEGPARFKVVFQPAKGAEDRLPLDSERYFALRVRPPVRFLPIRSHTGALDILRDVEILKVIDIAAAIYPSELEAYDLGRTDVVLWADAEVHNLSERDAHKLEEFVRRGGGFLAYLGIEARPGPLNRLCFAEKRRGLFPMLLDERFDTLRIDEEHPTAIDLDGPVQDHPLFKETKRFFHSPEILGFRPVTEYRQEDVVARYANGAPAVLEHRLGRGRVIIVTTTPDERAFRLNGSLLPAIFFFNAAHYLVAEQPGDRNVKIGQAVRIPLPPRTRHVVVEPPEEAGGITQEPVADATRPFVLADTAFPGFYRVTAKGVAASGPSGLPTEESFDVAVNLDPREGDLRRTSAAELRGAYRGVALHFTEDVEAILPRTAAAGAGELSRTLLGGVAFLLFLELLLAWRFGNRRRSAA
ncbi:MAG: BatA domain-containing protein [Planctomycetota bacterium]|jgi:hypothetical protein